MSIPSESTSQTATNFHYSELIGASSFRLLRILAHSNASGLQCVLEEFELDQCPEYVALSYCWGPSRESLVCSVNGQSFRIRTNLATALRQIFFDKVEDERYIWADAICINQDNMHEKEVQIRHMPQIFASARKVLAWLSRGDTEKKMLQNIQRFVNSNCALPDETKTAYTVYLSLMRAFVVICQLDYWRRIWIIQEISLARDIELVNLSARVSWNDFFRALEAHVGRTDSKHWHLQRKFHDYLSTATTQLTELNGLRSRLARHEPMPLLQALYWTRKCEATLYKDKIFGLLGLVTDTWLPLQNLNYGDNIEDVKRKITLAEMSDTSPGTADSESPCRLDILTFVNFSAHYVAGSPRWSPSWTDRNLYMHLRRWQILRLDRVALNLNATKALARFPERLENGALVLHGYSLGTLAAPGGVLFPYRRPAIFHFAAQSVMCELEQHERKGLIVWQPRARVAPEEDDTPWKADLERYRRRLGQLIEHLEVVTRQENEAPMTADDMAIASDQDRDLYDIYQQEIKEFLRLGSSLAEASSVWIFHRMRFFYSEKGFVGFGQHHGTPGDVIYLVEGCSVPVILRRYGSGLSSRGFVLIGEMFTFGVMQGQYFDCEDTSGILKTALDRAEREEIHLL